ncbi:MAG: hypothetical protein COA42_18240 [Alteromonadaceae bacterium]|nr:MAG: hypothetical protein COA42_18240 [Alteromonadaceae bacterium]
MRLITFVCLATSVLFSAQQASACGGFFCQFTPINQSGEQIVFKQDGDRTTTMVRIFYSGEASEFGWVLPVPATPELSVGDDALFNQLEAATRPQFDLLITGSECVDPTRVFEGATLDSSGFPLPVPTAVPSVVIEQSLEVGPFDAQVISSDSANALALWLADNNLDLTDRGSELLEPYVNAGMKFVVLKLQSDQAAGDIQPIILDYPSTKPVIPITLTSIAAQDDMDVIVWVLGDNRAVPENFLHVTPNYTRINWYTGSRNAYASYQTLITDAMNEAGGQGFATDYAGSLAPFIDQIATAEQLTANLTPLADGSAEYIVSAWDFIADPLVFATLQEHLPLPDGQDSSVYGNTLALATQYTQAELDNAATLLDAAIQEQIVTPRQNAYDLLDDDLYLTRLYTTLSADEMLLDPSFVFNPDMGDQALVRQATLNSECTDEGTDWTLTLGEGTGRTDEIVIDGRGLPPTFFATAPVLEQDASWQIALTKSSGAPEIQTERTFEIAQVVTFENTPNANAGNGDGTNPIPNTGNTDSGSTGGGGAAYWLSLMGLVLLMTRKKSS